MAELNLRSGIAYDTGFATLGTTLNDVRSEMETENKNLKEQIKTLNRDMKIARKRSWLNKKK